jgi:hypothetical protein
VEQVLLRPAASKSAGHRQKRASGWSGLSFIVLIVLVVLAVLAIEAILAFRLWVQLSGDQLDSSGLRSLYAISADLAAPFRLFETTKPVDPDRVLELSTIVAVEGYLVVGAVLLGVLLLTRRLVRAVGGAPSRSRALARARQRRSVARQTA